MSKKIIIVVTNHGDLGNTGKLTGWYLSEVAHPYDIFKKCGYDVVFVSPQGGSAPVDPGSVTDCTEKDKDEISKAFLANELMDAKGLKHTVAAAQCESKDYQAIFYAGGHGTMWDLALKTLNCEALAHLAGEIYDHGGVLAGVCHGVVGFLPIQISDKASKHQRRYITDGATLTAFTDDEEEEIGLTKEMPFSLEKRLESGAANFVGSPNWQCNVQVHDRIVTGQNPQSAKKTAEEVIRLLIETKK